jgi:hypothetical protein
MSKEEDQSCIRQSVRAMVSPIESFGLGHFFLAGADIDCVGGASQEIAFLENLKMHTL